MGRRSEDLGGQRGAPGGGKDPDAAIPAELSRDALSNLFSHRGVGEDVDFTVGMQVDEARGEGQTPAVEDPVALDIPEPSDGADGAPLHQKIAYEGAVAHAIDDRRILEELSHGALPS